MRHLDISNMFFPKKNDDNKSNAGKFDDFAVMLLFGTHNNVLQVYSGYRIITMFDPNDELYRSI